MKFFNFTNKKDIRHSCFIIWTCGWLICFLLFFFAPFYRGSLFPVENALMSFFKISGIYLPIIVAFCFFWYRLKRTSDNKTSQKIEYEQGIVTLVVVLLYNFFLIAFICCILFIAEVGESGNPFDSKFTIDEYLDFVLLFLNAPLTVFVTFLLAFLFSDN
jgi:hypothetical protein